MVHINYNCIIWDQRDRLTKEMDPVKVVTYLVNFKSITSSDKKVIEQIPPSKRKSELLKMIAVKGPQAYQILVKALEEDECYGAAFYLVRREMEEWKKGATRVSDDLEKERQEHKKTRQKLEEMANLKQEIEKLARELEDGMDATLEQKVVSSKHIQPIVDHVGPFTKDLGACLEVPTPEFLSIEEEHYLNREKIWKVLIRWKQRKGKEATVGVLVDVLYKLKQTEAADKLLGMDGLGTEVTRVHAQRATLEDERDLLRTNLEEERQKHATTRQELRNCKIKLKLLLIAPKGNQEQTQANKVPQANTVLGNEELRTAKWKQEQIKVKEPQVNAVQGNEEPKTAKRKEEQTQAIVQQANMVPGNEEFKSGEKKEAKTVTDIQEKMTASGMERLEKEQFSVRAQSATFKDERDQLRTNLEKEQQKPAITLQKLGNCEAKMERLLIASKGNDKVTAEWKQEQIKAKEPQVSMVQGNKESKTAKRKEEQTQAIVQQANMVPGKEEFKSGKKKEVNAVTNLQRKLTSTGKYRGIQNLVTSGQDPSGKLRPPKALCPIDYDRRTSVVKVKEMLFTGSGCGKDAPTFKPPLAALPRVVRGSIGKKKPSSKIHSEEEENMAKNMNMNRRMQQDSKRC